MNSVRRPYAAEALEPRRLLAFADPDPSFGGGSGYIVKDFYGGDDEAYAVAVQPDGKILAAGHVYFPGSRFIAADTYAAVARFNVDGSLDTAFGNQGVKFIFIAPYNPAFETWESGAVAHAVSVAPDGKIVVAGDVTMHSSNPIVIPEQRQWFFSRLNGDGSYDNGFGDGGLSMATFSNNDAYLGDMALQRDGRIVAAGQDGLRPADWVVARIKADGYFDPSFGGGDGYLRRDWGGWDVATGVALDHLDNIVVAGNVRMTFSRGDVAVARYLPDGEPDTSFGSAGFVEVIGQDNYYPVAHGVAVRPSGGVVVAGQAPDGQGWLAGFDVLGRPRGDRAAADASPLTDVLVRPDSRAIAVGWTAGLSDNYDFQLRDFDGGVAARTNLGGQDYAEALAFTPGGGVVVAGVRNADFNDPNSNFGIARYVGQPYQLTGAVTGLVFRDADGDGVRDPNETGHANVRVYADANNNGQFDPDTDLSTLSDTAGRYNLGNLPPRAYAVRQVVPLTFVQSYPSAGIVHVVFVTGGTTVTNRNFGNRPSSTQGGDTRILGSVFNDVDGDGVRDRGDGADTAEPDLAGQSVYLDLDRDGVLDGGEPTQTTDVAGNYQFDVSPGGYRVRAVPTAGWARTAPAAGFYEVTVAAGQDVSRVAFGTRQHDAAAAPPRVLAVFVSGRQWSGDFLAAVGGGGAGYVLPDPVDGQLAALPWTNLDRIGIRFSKPVGVARSFLALRGVNVPNYPLTNAFIYDPETLTATWNLDNPVGPDKLRLVLSDAVADASTHPLDGEYAGSFPTGNGVEGGDFAFRVDVLPGDVDRSGGSVNSIDLQLERNRQFTSTTNIGNPPYLYTAFHDVNGTGNINSIDLQLVRNRQFNQLPSGNPALVAPPPSVFGSTPIRPTRTAQGVGGVEGADEVETALT